MRRILLSITILLVACQKPVEKSSAPRTPDPAETLEVLRTRGLCLPVPTEKELSSEPLKDIRAEWSWRADMSSACVRAQARIFARGTDAAQVIADEAVRWCEPHANLEAAAAVMAWKNPPVLTYMEAFDQKEFDGWKATNLASLHNEAIREVLEARAGQCYGELVADSEYSHNVDIKP